MAPQNDAVYNFNNYWVSNFAFNDLNVSNAEFDYSFTPNGLFDKSTNEFFVTLNLEASYRPDDGGDNNSEPSEDGTLAEMEGPEFLSVTFVASFSINQELDFAEFQVGFFDEIINLLFPYLRSFLTMTTQIANLDPLVLPLMAMSDSGQVLLENTEIVNS